MKICRVHVVQWLESKIRPNHWVTLGRSLPFSLFCVLSYGEEKMDNCV